MRRHRTLFALFLVVSLLTVAEPTIEPTPTIPVITPLPTDSPQILTPLPTEQPPVITPMPTATPDESDEEDLCVPPDCTDTPVDEMCVPPDCTELPDPFNHITNPSFEDGASGWEVKLEGAFDENWCPHSDGTEVRKLGKGEELAIGTGDMPPGELVGESNPQLGP
ncbi:MAG: hypothetical protein QF415_09930 [Candidatus Undinarchaeales archaeon]|jgi:hypothetical protein|nr:hypothetical protein [Candidatus Undinarchaeales archaeon]MDP7492872.1 hypothetical protein [Candidatus Undinarchaeales archaeon]